MSNTEVVNMNYICLCGLHHFQVIFVLLNDFMFLQRDGIYEAT